MGLCVDGHVSALLQVAEICRGVGREELGASFLERRDKSIRAQKAAFKSSLAPEMNIWGQARSIDDDIFGG